ncbi:MAG: hypothetical protein GXO56_02095 [Chloroflexi bacterium]|nr:hypothetical protein [Chloroflexota bacterium]
MQELWEQFIWDLNRLHLWLLGLPQRVWDRMLDRFFVMTRPAGRKRLWLRHLLFLVVIGWIVYRHWNVIGDTRLSYYWNMIPEPVPAKILAVLVFGIPAYLYRVAMMFLMPESLRLLLLVILPYYLALYMTSRYLEDIYELSAVLKDPKDGLDAATLFLRRAAFSHNYFRMPRCRASGRSSSRNYREGEDAFFATCLPVLSIVEGEVSNRRSPLLLIGGPGYVSISADSAALFEHPNGTPRVLGPTHGRWHQIEGFERLRRIVNLRDHQLTLSVSTRSRDGIKIRVDDVQVLFSIYRGGRRGSRQEPYPFMPGAVERLVYNERGQNTMDRWERLASSRMLASTMRTMARTEIASFIRSQTLVQFLASVLPTDIAALEETYRELLEEMRAEASRAHISLGPPEAPQPGRFVWRSQIAERFDALANGPHGSRARQRGVGLKWVGLGAWQTAVDKVLEEHIEAWRLSVRNMMRGSPQVLRQLERERRISTLVQFARELIASYQQSGNTALEREIALLRYYAHRLDVAMDLKYGSIQNAPTSWRRASEVLHSHLPRDID